MEKTNKVNLKVLKLIKIASKEFECFFGVKIKPPKLIFYQTRKQINKYYGKKTPAWLVGWAKKDEIHILAYEKFTEESSHIDREDFWRTFKHELVHLYFKKMVKSINPCWLNEGVSCFLAGQKKIIKDPAKFKNPKFYYKKADAKIYVFGYVMVKHLISFYGEKKFLDFLDSWSRSKKTQRFFEKIFKKEFGMSPNDFWLKIKREIKNQTVLLQSGKGTS